mgnify:CR=1 FL=1
MSSAVIFGGTGLVGSYLIKTDSEGNTVWEKEYDGNHGYYVEQTSDGGYIISGATSSFGNGAYDVYLIKTDEQGNVTSTIELPTPSSKRESSFRKVIEQCLTLDENQEFSDIDSVIVDAMTSAGLNSIMILVMMVVIWLILGMLLDSISIILLTVPLFILLAGDMNPYAFAIFGILAIEAGLLTPPFGLIVYTVKGVLAAGGDNVSLGSIFKGSIPYWIMMLIVMLLVAFFPALASWPTQFV